MTRIEAEQRALFLNATQPGRHWYARLHPDGTWFVLWHHPGGSDRASIEGLTAEQCATVECGPGVRVPIYPTVNPGPPSTKFINGEGVSYRTLCRSGDHSPCFFK